MLRTPADILHLLRSRPERLIAGIMTGTSLDAIDVAFVRIAGEGESAAIRSLLWREIPFESSLRQALERLAESESGPLDELCLLNAGLAHAYAEAYRAAAAACGVDPAAVDLIGCHGQTLRHLPEPRMIGGRLVRSTLQIGSGAALAALTGIPVLSDFRSADMALGGQGAPLVPYADWLLFRSASADRIVLNIGGIANITFLPAGCGRDAVIASDTGPGNMVIDALARKYFGEPFDRGGARAARGRADDALLALLLAHEYFARPHPKSTGRETFGAAYVEALCADNDARFHLRPEDLLATCTELTARTIAAEIARRAPEGSIEVIAGGGGVHNTFLIDRLRRLLPGAAILPSDALGVSADAKEAVAFALFACAWLDGNQINFPSVTGARRPALCGSLSLP